ncbi:MAG TPA: hypothetical protein ACFE0H_01905 [Elainellaceae cyanobacterium]|jgi:hypothetical protein
MNWYSQLTRLILDFYREDPLECQQIRALPSCRLSRWWGVLRINCRDRETAESLVAAAAILREPIAQLRLAQRIKILVNGSLFRVLPVNVSNSDQRQPGTYQS